ncbi:protein of unknown function [Rhodovastum atsumiense]|nr:protein of unknown function [Rhodovastum atsumiense]
MMEGHQKNLMGMCNTVSMQIIRI